MAQITVNIPDQHLPILREALADWWDINEVEVDAAKLRETMAVLLKSLVREYEWKQAKINFQGTDIGDGT